MLLSPNNILNKPISLSKLMCMIIVVALIVGNIFFVIKYFNAQKTLQQAQTMIKKQNRDGKVLIFTKLFVDKVLNATNEVSFETRLELENSVRVLEDEEILSQWQKFTESKTESEAQEEVKKLLGALINKIIIVFQ